MTDIDTRQAKSMITRERLMEVLDYDPLTGVFTCKVARGARTAGAVSGCLNSLGYRRSGIDGRQYNHHRLAWLYVHGVWPSQMIDHINMNKDDNRIANLREATRSQNKANGRCTAPSGLKGVTRNRARLKWVAQIKANGKVVHLGTFDTAEEAHAAYMRAARKVHGEFARAE